MNGWIKLHRKMTDWSWYQDSKMVHLFLHLLLKANSHDGSWKGTVVKRGQLICGRRKLALETGISEQTIYRKLRLLEAEQQITTKSNNRFTLITICKYEEYQTTNKEPRTTNDTAPGTTDGTRTRSKEERIKNNRRQGKEETSARVQASVCCSSGLADWLQ
ncbi:MAG: hypothetical protein GY696_16030 [Gammaproteobacteria bacterium]|nr:hypothetical protein [Gammaproteobacteria bacterium]